MLIGVSGLGQITLSSASFSCFLRRGTHNRSMVKSESYSRFADSIRIKKPAARQPQKKATRTCSIKGCENEATCRVPKNRELSSYVWVCQGHAREHNEKWDYFKGMSEADIARFQEESLTGHRPTWPLGKRAAGMSGAQAGQAGNYQVEDGFAVFGDGEPEKPRRPERILTGLQRQAFDTLGLEPSATLNEIKARYKELVKRFHPDANGGDRGTEERLKQVIKAYSVLRASGLIS
jgi:DnaJ-class molecular chaperone with C-terminal Zn finger domain